MDEPKESTAAQEKPAREERLRSAAGEAPEMRRRALAVGFGAVALFTFALLLAIYWQLAGPILWAVTLTILFYPLHRRILRLTGGRAALAASISTVLALAVIFIPAIIAVVHLLAEVRDLWPSVRDSLGPAAFERLATAMEGSRLRSLYHFVLGQGAGSGVDALQARLADLAFHVQTFILNQLRHVTRSVPAAVVGLGVTILAFYFFLLQGQSWVEQIQAALPLEKGHAEHFFKIGGQTINAVFRGVILTAAVQAALAGLAYWVVGAPAPLLLCLATLVAALIPFVGPVVIWLPTAIGLYLAGRVGPAVGLGLWGMLAVSLIDNFLRPYLIGRGTKLPLLWLFLSILGGLRLFGFLGVVVGPLSLALALACYRIYLERRSL